MWWGLGFISSPQKALRGQVILGEVIVDKPAPSCRPADHRCKGEACWDGQNAARWAQCSQIHRTPPAHPRLHDEWRLPIVQDTGFGRVEIVYREMDRLNLHAKLLILPEHRWPSTRHCFKDAILSAWSKSQFGPQLLIGRPHSPTFISPFFFSRRHFHSLFKIVQCECSHDHSTCGLNWTLSRSSCPLFPRLLTLYTSQHFTPTSILAAVTLYWVYFAFLSPALNYKLLERRGEALLQ